MFDKKFISFNEKDEDAPSKLTNDSAFYTVKVLMISHSFKRLFFPWDMFNKIQYSNNNKNFLNFEKLGCKIKLRFLNAKIAGNLREI